MTNAGQRALDELAESPLDGARYAHHVVGLRIAAIEAEAVAAERDRIRAAVEGLHREPPPRRVVWWNGYETMRAAVLGIIDGETP